MRFVYSPFFPPSLPPSLLPSLSQDYPDDLKEKVAENVRNNRHPLDTSASKGAISVFIGNLPFSVRVGGREGGLVPPCV